MKIAIIAPPWIPIPPPKYGGIELVVYNLVEGLVELGEEVILFGPKDSKVSCKVCPYLESPLYFGLDSPEDEKSFVAELSSKYAYARASYEKVDIIHDHTLYNFATKVPTIHTVHGGATEGAIKECVELAKNPKNHFIAISKRQKELYSMLNPDIKFLDVIPHAVDVKAIGWSKDKEDFFLFVGRASWQKGIDLAVSVANKAKLGLVMAVKMAETYEKEFFKKEIEPLLEKHPKDILLQLYGEVSREFLFGLFRRAKGTLFTSHWEEPFGLVMLESMACGTPVIALKRGAAPEIIIDGKTGILVNTAEEMVEATKRVGILKPEDCRRHAEENFSRQKMAKNYLKAYKKALSLSGAKKAAV
ncbi:MAG: glycosyltransferase family 4 protein [Candidatus Omnitrophica bacterium]|nr:glycosyltransferase family 4 protein [Candidatus Omnitrophota bacterium]